MSRIKHNLTPGEAIDICMEKTGEINFYDKGSTFCYEWDMTCDVKQLEQAEEVFAIMKEEV